MEIIFAERHNYLVIHNIYIFSTSTPAAAFVCFQTNTHLFISKLYIKETLTNNLSNVYLRSFYGC